MAIMHIHRQTAGTVIIRCRCRARLKDVPKAQKVYVCDKCGHWGTMSVLRADYEATQARLDARQAANKEKSNV